MSKSYDNEIIASAIKILKEDITDPDPSNDEYCIYHYVEKRIYQLGSPYLESKYPNITIDFVHEDSHMNLPNAEGVMIVNVWYSKSAKNVKTNLRRCGGRIIDLFNRKPDSINSQGFGAKVRTIRKMYGEIILPKNETEGFMSFEIRFEVVFGDSWSGY